MNGIVKFGILFMLLSVVLASFGTYVSTLFGSFGATMTYISTGSVGLVISSLVGYVGWFLDLIFLNDSLAYSTLSLAPSITIPSIAYALTFFRILLGCTIFVLILSLVFGHKGE